MLASGTLIPISAIPEPYQTYLWWNPIAHPIELMRAGFYPQVGRENVDVLFVVLISLGAFAIGMVMLHKMVRDAMES